MDLNGEWHRFVDSIAKTSSGEAYLNDEIDRFAQAAMSKGFRGYPGLPPIFHSPTQTQTYDTFCDVTYDAIGRVLDVLADPGHPKRSDVIEHLNIPFDQLALLNALTPGVRPEVIRPDTVYNGSLKAHEINVSWPGGVLYPDFYVEALRRSDLFEKFQSHAQSLGVEIDLPDANLNQRMLLEQILGEARSSNPYVVLMVPDDRDEVTDRSLRHFEQYVRDQGHRCDVLHPSQYQSLRKSLKSNGTLDSLVIYRVSEWSHVRSDEHMEAYALMVRDALVEGVPNVNSYLSEVVSAKSIFELFWDDSLKEIFDGPSLDTLRRHIPYTQNLAEVPFSMDQLGLEKDRWVIKPIKGSSGQSVFLGFDMDYNSWVSVLTDILTQGLAVERQFVLQEVAHHPKHTMSMVRGSAYTPLDHTVDLGPFIFGGKRGHTVVRYSGRAQAGNIRGHDNGGFSTVLNYSIK